jgi:hypothetical protein
MTLAPLLVDEPAHEHEDAVLVTADDRYYGKAERYGTIAALRDWGRVR